MDIGNIASGLGGGITVLAGSFIKEFWQDRKERRAVEGEDKTRGELIALLKKELEDRVKAETETSKNMASLASSLHDMVQSIRAQGEKLGALRDHVMEIKGSLRKAS